MAKSQNCDLAGKKLLDHVPGDVRDGKADEENKITNCHLFAASPFQSGNEAGDGENKKSHQQQPGDQQHLQRESVDKEEKDSSERKVETGSTKDSGKNNGEGADRTVCKKLCKPFFGSFCYIGHKLEGPCGFDQLGYRFALEHNIAQHDTDGQDTGEQKLVAGGAWEYIIQGNTPEAHKQDREYAARESGYDIA